MTLISATSDYINVFGEPIISPLGMQEVRLMVIGGSSRRISSYQVNINQSLGDKILSFIKQAHQTEDLDSMGGRITPLCVDIRSMRPVKKGSFQFEGTYRDAHVNYLPLVIKRQLTWESDCKLNLLESQDRLRIKEVFEEVNKFLTSLLKEEPRTLVIDQFRSLIGSLENVIVNIIEPTENEGSLEQLKDLAEFLLSALKRYQNKFFPEATIEHIRKTIIGHGVAQDLIPLIENYYQVTTVEASLEKSVSSN